MKETLTLKGQIEVSRPEITKALNNGKPPLTRAVYVVEGNTIKSVVCDVEQQLSVDRSIPEFSLPKVKEEPVSRNMSSGWKRHNVGVFKTIEDFTKDYKSRGLNRISFEELLKDIVDLYPKMDRAKLAIYLRDKRQLKTINYDSRTQTVTF